jgi:hypothetical protein
MSRLSVAGERFSPEFHIDPILSKSIIYITLADARKILHLEIAVLSQQA